MVQEIFQYRKSMRLAQIEINGELVDAYVSNSADMDFMKPGAICYLREVDNPKRSTAYDLFSVYDHNTLVCVDAKEPLTVARDWYAGILKEELKSDDIFLIENTKNMDLLCGRRRCKDDIWIQVMGTSLINNRIAFLPERRSSALNQRLEDVLSRYNHGHDIRLVFVVCREDADSFSANTDADPYFADLVDEILESGVRVECLRCKVTEDGMITEGQIPINKVSL